LDASSPAPAPPGGPDRLKLRAVDEEDLAVLAAFLQDSIACVGEMAYLPEERRFALIVCRFCWERAMKEDTERLYDRIECAITIEGVDAPQYRGFSLRERSRLMPLLTLGWHDGVVQLTFGGGAGLRLKAASLDLRMEDVGPCWPTRYKPEHAREAP
jgi:hypothetical protein